MVVVDTGIRPSLYEVPASNNQSMHMNIVVEVDDYYNCTNYPTIDSSPAISHSIDNEEENEDFPVKT